MNMVSKLTNTLKVIYNRSFKRLSLTLPKMLSTCNLEGVGVEHGNINVFRLAWITRGNHISD